MRWLKYGVLWACLLVGFYPVNTPAAWRVALIDHFYPVMDANGQIGDLHQQRVLYGLLDLDNDGLPDPLYHGDLVQRIAAHPDLIFLRYPLTRSSTPLLEISRQLALLHHRHRLQPVDALLLAWESSTLISAFESPLIPEHRSHYKAILRDWSHSQPVWRRSLHIIQQLEALVRDGVQVFTIAGNGGPRMVNTFSFAEGVVTVGAREPELKHFISDNPFVSRYARSAYRPVRLAAGFDLDDDGCVDIHSERTEADVRVHWQQLKGSSFAAPAALRAALAAQPVCPPQMQLNQ